MTDATATFSALRPRLHGIAYRMLGSVAESEDVVQDVWISWHGADVARIENSEAWLVAATTRRSIDRLRAARLRREQYVGIWLPEPIPTDDMNSPEALEELAGDLSVAFLTVLERLTPEARAAFLLREVFDTDYSEIATVLGRSEASCRQLVHRAKDQVRDGRPRRPASPDTHRVLMQRFATAMQAGDFPAICVMLAEDAVLTGDGGGKVKSFARPMVGGQRIAQLLYAPSLRPARAMRIGLADINGECSVLRYFDGRLESVQTYVFDNERIIAIHVQRNPDKLRSFVKSPIH